MRSADRLRRVFSPGRVDYRNFPEACAREHYDRAVEIFVDRARHVRGVIGVGRYGNVTAPGISDIDLVVVTEDEVPACAGDALSIAGLPEFERNLFMHEATILPAGGLVHVCEHLDVPAIETIWGSVPPLPHTEPDERRWHELAILAEWLGCYCRFFGEVACLGVCNVRWALPVLHSLRYSAQLTGRFVTNPPAAWSTYPERVAQLRADWFGLSSDSERAERLAECLSEGWHVTADMCARLEAWIDAEGLLPSLGAGRDWSVYSYEPAKFAIVARCESAAAMIDRVLNIRRPRARKLPGRLERLSQRVAPSWCLVPRFHEAFAMAAAAAAPGVHRHTAQRWFGGRPITPLSPTGPFEAYLCRRMARLERQAEYLERNGLEFGSSCSDLVYAPPTREEAAESWRRRLLLRAQKAWGAGRLRGLVHEPELVHSAA